MANEKATIFLAHSHLDIRSARQVRNMFEDLDHDVLLLQLSQQMSEEYLSELLRREIQARDWLVELRSANARQSSWVNFEQARARSERKPFYVIDLERCGALPPEDVSACLKEQVMTVSRDIRVFISYSRMDRELAERLRGDLASRGYEVRADIDRLRLGENPQAAITTAIDTALANGGLVLLMSPASLSSDWVRFEVEYAMKQKGTVIPCLADMVLPSEVPPELRKYHWIDLAASYEHGLARVVDWLQHRDAAK